jgi:hypothetical protein
MCPTRHPELRLGVLRLTCLVAATALWSGCGSDGAGTIHMNSPQARRQTMQTGAGPTPSGAMTPATSGAPVKSVARTPAKGGVGKAR